MAENPPRDHHYIPQFYQRPWTGDDGKVERYTNTPKGIHRARLAPAAVGYGFDLYRHPRKEMDEWEAQALELKVFGKIDDDAAKALEALLSSRDALKDNSIRLSWSIFLRTMLLRTPYQMSATLASLEMIWRNTDVSEKYAAIWQPGMPATAEQWLESLNPNEAKESAFRMYVDAIGSDRTTHHMMNMPWRVFDCSDADHRLLLSDHPVILVPLATAEGHIAMPLSPTKYLVAATEPRMKAVADGLRPKQAVRLVNKLTVERAQHYVIADDKSQDAFIRKHFGKKPISPFLGPDNLHIRGREGKGKDPPGL